MVLKLYGYPISTCVKRAATVLHEKKLPFEFVVVDLAKGAQKSPGYLEKNPFGLLPLLEDDGVIVYESRAIGRYIANKYAGEGTPLLPKNPKDMKELAAFEQAMATESANFDTFAWPAAVEISINPLMGMPINEDVVNKNFEKLEEKLLAYDKILSKQRYLAGDNISLADIHHLPHAHALTTYHKRNIIAEFPHVDRWIKELQGRESWKAVVDGVKSVPEN
ncbi:glutathione S-transferase [Flagelloscypha sp. PMI_526]|nr:glutathione S-transferase [Flagelloscypha sp. PMI_526]